MFIHLGGYNVIRSKDVICILDYDVHELSSVNKYFLQSLQEENIIRISEETIKSIIITDEKVYYSPISSTTLKRRAHTSLEDHNEEEIEPFS